MRQVVVVGPGRVGTTLALALRERGARIVSVAGRSQAGVQGFTERFPEAEPLPVDRAVRTGDHVLLCVPDDALEPLAREVATADVVAEGSRWVHVAGGHGAGVLRPIALAGGRVAACHPAQTFPDPERALRSLPGTTWAVTAADPDLGWARVLVTDLGGSPVTVPEANRTLYHTGLAVGANGSASLVTLARDLLAGAGIEHPEAFLGPLVVSSAGNAAERGAGALTGPVRRGDAGTVARQLRELQVTFPEAVDLVVELGRVMLAQARRAGLAEDEAEAVLRALDEFVGKRS